VWAEKRRPELGIIRPLTLCMQLTREIARQTRRAA